ncbi:hypothetical protein HPP92_029104 [Vanilla planifolia]|uniref:Uncharacterized protein n=1 Tax=Vanilla planifolia TaxID=51239 RepID=A0A835P539_VANPL|nr:hypothetical protein HPP92_029104 [Vanilla planifolia]
MGGLWKLWRQTGPEQWGYVEVSQISEAYMFWCDTGIEVENGSSHKYALAAGRMELYRDWSWTFESGPGLDMVAESRSSLCGALETAGSPLRVLLGPLLRCLRLDVNGEANSSRFFRSNSAFRPEANQKQIAAEWAIRRSNEFLDWLEFEDSYEQQLGELLQFLVRWSHEITKPLHQQQEYMEVQRTTGDLSLSLRNVESHECKSSGEAQR